MRLVLLACLLTLSACAHRMTPTIPSGKVSGELRDTPGNRVAHRVKYQFEWWLCDANWNQECTGTELVQADPNWQVCKPLFTKTEGKGDHDFRWSPEAFNPNDARPQRFGAVRFHIRATGRGNQWFPQSAKVRVEWVGIDMIPATADNATRWSERCEMP